MKYTNLNKNEIEKKYPEGYLSHYLAMFSCQSYKPTLDNFNSFNDLYVEMEGKDGFVELQKELECIKLNNDLHLFLRIANYEEFENFEMEQLHEMVNAIEAYIIEKK